MPKKIYGDKKNYRSNVYQLKQTDKKKKGRSQLKYKINEQWEDIDDSENGHQPISICFKILFALLLSSLFIFLDIETQKQLFDMQEINRHLSGVLQIHIIKDKRTYFKKYQSKNQPFLIPISSKSLEVRLDVEYSLGYDLRRATVQTTMDQNGNQNIHIHFNNVEILGKNILNIQITNEQTSFLNAWSNQEKNLIFKKINEDLQQKIKHQITSNASYLEQIQTIANKGLTPFFQKYKKTIVSYKIEQMLDYFSPISKVPLSKQNLAIGQINNQTQVVFQVEQYVFPGNVLQKQQQTRNGSQKSQASIQNNQQSHSQKILKSIKQVFTNW